MNVRNRQDRTRRGVSVLECAVVYPVAFLLLIGMLILGSGVFRAQLIATMAREGARWASVHGPTYQQEQNQPAPTSQSVYTNAVAPLVVALDTTQLSCTLTSTSTTVSVTVQYNWMPEAFFTPITLSSTSVMPITC